MTMREFEIHCGIGNGSISKAINNNTDLSQKTLNRISKKYPALNINWLANGEGEMLSRGDEKDSIFSEEYWREKYYKILEENNALLRERNKK